VKRVAAREAKNRFGQLIDDAQREPVTIEKNGRPFVVVQSYTDFVEAQELKRAALKVAIDEARAEFRAGRDMPFDEAAVKEITELGRQRLADRQREK
jgi:prevent-host-death family protein